jgi:hypothetical protein
MPPHAGWTAAVEQVDQEQNAILGEVLPFWRLCWGSAHAIDRAHPAAAWACSQTQPCRFEVIFVAVRRTTLSSKHPDREDVLHGALGQLEETSTADLDDVDLGSVLSRAARTECQAF